MIAFLSFLTSDLVGWEPTMCSDGLVSKESLRDDTVSAMVVGEVVGACVGTCCGGRWMSCGWCFWMAMEVLQWWRDGALDGAFAGPVASVGPCGCCGLTSQSTSVDTIEVNQLEANQVSQ